MNLILCDTCAKPHGYCERCGRFYCTANEYAWCPRPITDGQKEREICGSYKRKWTK